MKFLPTRLDGVILVEPDVHGDERGFFIESFHAEKYRQGGIGMEFVQDNHSSSRQGTLRGLHAQRTRPQGKLVRAVEGEVFDVAVDIRRSSPRFLDWVGVVLSAENFPPAVESHPDFAHGFCVLSPRAQVEYKCTDFYVPEDDLSILWSDPSIGIDWPIAEPLLSEKDRNAPTTDAITSLLPE